MLGGQEEHIGEVDSVPPLFLLWDVVWLLATSGNFLLFVIQFTLIAWIKYPDHALFAAIIMTPIILLVLLSALASITGSKWAKYFGTPDFDRIRKKAIESQMANDV